MFATDAVPKKGTKIERRKVGLSDWGIRRLTWTEAVEDIQGE